MDRILQPGLEMVRLRAYRFLSYEERSVESVCQGYNFAAGKLIYAGSQKIRIADQGEGGREVGSLGEILLGQRFLQMAQRNR